MKEFKAAGTLGDVYLICCKLYGYGTFCMNHYTKHTHWHGKIAEIYSLLGTYVVIHFINDKKKWGELDCPTITPYFKDGNMEYFPEWEFEKRMKLVDNYRVINIKSGRADQEHREIPLKKIKEIYDKGGYGLSTYIIGTEITGKGDSLIFQTYDLTNKTTILEALEVVAGAKIFYGFQGLWCFVALSMKVPTVIYVKTKCDKEAIERRIPPEHKKYLKEVIQV